MDYTFADGTVKQTPISVNGQPLPPPAYDDGMTVGKEDLHSEAERTAAGYLATDLIRSDVVKIELSWPHLSVEDTARLEAAIGKNMWKTVAFLDNNVWHTLTMYKGPFKKSPYRLLKTGKLEGYRNITLNLIEK